MMKKIQLTSAYGGLGMAMIEKGSYFVRGSYNPPAPPNNLNTGNGQETAQTDIVAAMKKSIGCQIFEANA